MQNLMRFTVGLALVLPFSGCSSGSANKEKVITEDAKPEGKAKLEKDLADQESLQKSVISGTAENTP